MKHTYKLRTVKFDCATTGIVKWLTFVTTILWSNKISNSWDTYIQEYEYLVSANCINAFVCYLN